MFPEGSSLSKLASETQGTISDTPTGPTNRSTASDFVDAAVKTLGSNDLVVLTRSSFDELIQVARVFQDVKLPYIELRPL